MNDYTDPASLEKQKYLLINIYAEYLRWSSEMIGVSYKDKIVKLEAFVEKMRPIKNLSVLSKIRKKYLIKEAL